MGITAILGRAAGLVLFAGLAGCASSSTEPEAIKPDPVTEAVEQPFRDLNVVRHASPPEVARAAKGPYAPPTGDCEQLRLDIAALNKELGPDLDMPQPKHHTGPDELVGDAVGSALHLPFRGVVRSVTGAAEHDRLLALAVTAGVARRAFLRGVAAERGCDRPGESATAAP